MNLQEYRQLELMLKSEDRTDAILAIHLIKDQQLNPLLIRKLYYSSIYDVHELSFDCYEYWKKCQKETLDIVSNLGAEIEKHFNTDREIEELLIKSDRNEIKVE